MLIRMLIILINFPRRAIHLINQESLSFLLDDVRRMILRRNLAVVNRDSINAQDVHPRRERETRLYHNKYSSNVRVERKTKKEEFPEHAAFLLIVGERARRATGRCLILLVIFNYSRWQGK